jgi:hypothetical protein
MHFLLAEAASMSYSSAGLEHRQSLALVLIAVARMKAPSDK